MNRKITLFSIVLLALAQATAQSAPAAATMPAGAEIKPILSDRIDVAKKSVGIVVGTIAPQGSQVVGHGKISATDARTPDGDTVFEIGSVTKVFTSLLLADMVEKGEVKLDDPVSKFLP